MFRQGSFFYVLAKVSGFFYFKKRLKPVFIDISFIMKINLPLL